MDTKIRCQSCGMPLGEGYYGTNADGNSNQEYCTFCWQNGTYTNPNQTLEGMIEISIENMKKEVGLPEDKARTLANSFIPQLKRWKQYGRNK